MKNLYVLLGFFIVAGFHSCKKQDDVYLEFVKNGGYIYPEKTNDLTGYDGHNRVKLVWAAPKDPSVKTAKVYWNNKTDMMEITYANYSGNQIELVVENLKERSYTFQLVNFDANGNQSMISEITTTPYAENWLLTHAERTVSSAEIKGSAAEIVMNFGTDEMIATQFRYVNTDGATVILDEIMDANNNKISLPDAANGKRFEFRSSYCPTMGLDTIWNDWSKSSTPIAGLLDCKSWGISVTANQIWDGTFMPARIFDGIIDRDHRWVSAQGSFAGVFPKIIAVDAQKDSYFINKISLSQDLFTQNRRFGNGVEIYWGNEPFDPDAGSNYANSPAFANAIAKGNMQITTFYFSTQTWTRSWSEMQNFRYLAVVWKNSRSANGWIDLWEMQFYGYDAEG